MSRPITLFTGQWADLPLEVRPVVAEVRVAPVLEVSGSVSVLSVSVAASDSVELNPGRDGEAVSCSAPVDVVLTVASEDALVVSSSVA